MVDAPFIPVRTDPDRRPLLGYGMTLAAAALFAVNGTVSKVILASNVSSLRLSEVRTAGAGLLLLVGLALLAPGRLRLRPGELPFLAVYGIGGVATVQWLYFVAIHRLPIGIALLIEYLAPLLVALWARFVLHEHVRRRIWAALVLALGGLSLVAEIWSGLALNGTGVAAALIAAVVFAAYILMAEHAVGRRDPISLNCYGFLFAALFWSVVQPWWSFPAAIADDRVSLLGRLAGLHLPIWALVAWMVVLGTIVPFWLVVSALQHIPASRAAIVAMLEPVAASVVAFAWLGESFGATQLVGGGVVLTGIVLAQSAR